MKVHFESADTTDGDLYRVFTSPGGFLVGYVRHDPDAYTSDERASRWVVTDHIKGHAVIIHDGALSGAKAKARRYFEHRHFCAEGCGRVVDKGQPRCEHCRNATAERGPALCYVRGVYGDIYKVVRMGDDDDARVLVGNINHWAPTIYRAWEVLENIGRGLYTVVPAADIASVPGL